VKVTDPENHPNGAPGTLYNDAYIARSKMYDVMLAKLRAAAAAHAAGVRSDTVVSVMLASFEEHGVDVSKDENIKDLADNIVFLMVAGTETAAFTLATIAVTLWERPEWLRALNEEQDRVVAEHGEEWTVKVCSIWSRHVYMSFAMT
jgi:cytochrome P450